MFYTDTNKANLIISENLGWPSVTSLNPATTPYNATGDDSYAIYVRLNDLSSGQSDEFTWYYAAGELAELTQTIADVAQASGAISNITYTTADFTANSSTSGTGYYLVVPRGATAPTEAQIAAGGDYGSVSIITSGNGSITANTSKAFSLSGLQPGTEYDLHFVVKNGDTYSAISTTQFSTTNQTAPGAPTNVTATSGNGQASVSFDSPASDGGSDLTGYTVTANPGGMTAGGISSPITVTGLTNGTSYTFTVKASNAIGTGQASSSSSSVTPMRVSDPPTNVAATSGNGKAIVRFSAPTDNGGLTITGYTVTASPSGITASGSSSPITVTGLTNGTSYTFTVVATTAAGDSLPSDSSESVMPATTPGEPQNVSALAGNGEASVSFDSPSNNGGLEISSYTVTTNPGGITVQGTSSPITVTGLSNGTSYTFTVTASNALGNSQTSSPSNAVTPKRVADPPTNVAVTPGDGQVTITFTPPTDNGGSTITDYTVTASPGGITASNETSPITLTGLSNGTAYRFTVVATNSLGDSLPSVESDPVIPASAPDTPTNLVATAGNGEATVAFEEPSNNGGRTITGYMVTASPGGITAGGISSPILVTGLTNGTAYTFTVVAINPAGDSVSSAESQAITPAAGRTTPSVQSLVQMDGVSFSPGTVQTAYVSGVKSAVVNAANAITTKIKQLVDAIEPIGLPESAKEMKIDLTKLKAEKVDVRLTGDVLEKMGENDMTLNVVNGEISHLIPAKDINVLDISENLGLVEHPEKVEIRIQIENPGEEVTARVRERAETSGYEIVLPPMNFEVTAVNLETNEEKTVKRFADYVGRLFQIPEGVDPSKITTGIVLNADGTFSHVPTAVIGESGAYFARINSLTNSTYSVIWNPLSFMDMENHWAKEAANNLGARLIVTGDEVGNLHPDGATSRGEFILMLTKALGIYRTGTGTDRFADVPKISPYFDAVSSAVDYGLISGYPDGTFRPEQLLTREEMITIFAKASLMVKLDAIKENTLADFLDRTKVSAWAKPYMDQAIRTGLVSGNQGMLNPKKQPSLAESISLIERMLKNSGLINP